jgi:dihydropteroate synthase
LPVLIKSLNSAIKIVTLSEKPEYINIGGTLLSLSVPKVMGIINITPDSFYKSSRYVTDSEIVTAAVKMNEEGVDIIDVGGYSSRPGAQDITIEAEEKRVLNAIKLIKRELPGVIISIDTFRSEIVKKAILDYGANIINDISGFETDDKMFGNVAELNVPYILMHMQGFPGTMQDNPQYDDVVGDILKWFGERIYRLASAGVKDIIVDPGFGFGKTVEHNFEILRRLCDFSVTGLPLLAGISRKSMIWKTLGTSAGEGLNGTTALNMVALLNGADILRVHDVKEAVETIKLFQKLKGSVEGNSNLKILQ